MNKRCTLPNIIYNNINTETNLKNCTYIKHCAGIFSYTSATRIAFRIYFDYQGTEGSLVLQACLPKDSYQTAKQLFESLLINYDMVRQFTKFINSSSTRHKVDDDR